MIRGVVVRPSAEPTLVSAPRAAAWSLRLLLLAVAFGLVLMHHIVGAHQHRPEPPAPGPAPTHAVSGHAAGPVASSATADITEHTTGHAPEHAEAAAHHAPAVTPPAVSAPTASATDSGGAALHVHPDPHGPDLAALFHECLALLAAAAALALLVASRRAAPERRRRTRPARSPGASRPPPTPVPLRLAQLQILRL